VLPPDQSFTNGKYQYMPFVSTLFSSAGTNHAQCFGDNNF